MIKRTKFKLIKTYNNILIMSDSRKEIERV